MTNWKTMDTAPSHIGARVLGTDGRQVRVVELRYVQTVGTDEFVDDDTGIMDITHWAPCPEVPVRDGDPVDMMSHLAKDEHD